ncbi:hypothetical protein niasHT_035190 [Heterodera trifolii]|uniref:Beta-catenin-like protein 1 n=1 Tax=Heterodera trifolii TaxID=157864 RepID=A0ABD2IWR9_9BILA
MSTIGVDEIFKLSQKDHQPPEKRSKLSDGSTQNVLSVATAKNGGDILEALEKSEDTSELNEIDEASVKRICFQLERKQAKNAELRIKYAEEPPKFMESEIELNNAIQEMHVIAAEPQFYDVLVEQGSVQLLLQLLSHENTDIIAAVCNLLQELTDVEILHESEEGAKVLVDELIKGHVVETLVQQPLVKLNEQIQDEADAVYNAMNVVENLLDFHPQANDLCVSQGLFDWLMVRATKRKVFDANKLFASQLFAMLLQSCESARKRLTEKRDGIDMTLRALAVYKRHNPGSPDEHEHMENLFDALCAALMYVPNRQVFLDGEGLQLMILMLKEKKMSREGALKVLSHATAIPDGGPNCDKFVEIYGLSTLFPLFMRTPPKMKRKDTSPEDHEEFCCSVVDALLFSCNPTNCQRVLQKFVDHCFEKIDRAVELFLKYSEKVQRFETKTERRIASLAEEEKPDIEELYLEKLNNGLYTLQRAALILAEICSKGAPGCHERVEKLFRLRLGDGSVGKQLEPILREFHRYLDSEADTQKQRVELLIAHFTQK